ncbi:invasin, partial [Serratia sp. S1B]
TAKSQLSASPASLVADGNSASTLRLDLKDANDNPVSGQTVEFSASRGTAGSVTDMGDGTYTALLKGTEAGTATITVTVGGAPFAVNAASVVLTADSGNLSTAKSQLLASPASVVADGSRASTLSLMLKDANDNPVSGQTVVFSASRGTAGSVTEVGDGTYTALLKGTEAGTATITVTVGGAPFAVNAASVVLTADSGNLSTAKSQLSASPASIVADGSSASTLSLTLKDANDNPVSGQTVVFSASRGTAGSVTDMGDGTYTALLKGTEAGTAMITVTVGGAPFAVNAASVVLTADSGNLSTAKSQLSASPASIVADGSSASTLSLTLKDANDNPVSGQTVVFSASRGTAGSVTEVGDGTYTALLKGTEAGTAMITVTVGGAPFAVNAASVALTADSSNLSTAKSQLSASPASLVADGNSASTLRLDLKDANDNPVSGQTVEF